MLARRTIAIILGGGTGSRLYPLTSHRSKPAVPIAGKFRLIDIPISNCLNSDIHRMFVLTQFNSASLNRHIKNAYRFDKFSRGFVDIMAAEQTADSMDWFQGTADAVRQSVKHLNKHDFDHVMILSGDQLYQMDFRKILKYHHEKGAQLTVATIPVVAEEATAFGILKANGDGVIEDFIEKPSMEKLPDWTSEVAPEYANAGKHYLASMGIYVFTAGVLSKLFAENPKSMDFGKEIIPYAVHSPEYKTTSYAFGNYWTDIGTISSFFEANLQLTDYLPQFNLYDNKNRLYTNSRMLSPSKIFGTRMTHALISGGGIIHASEINRSIIGVRSRIGKNTVIDHTILMGIDYYQTLKDLDENPEQKLLGIGDNCVLRNTIVDKNVRVGDNCTIIGSDQLEDSETDHYCIREGIIIVKKGASIPDNTKIGI